MATAVRAPGRNLPQRLDAVRIHHFQIIQLTLRQVFGIIGQYGLAQPPDVSFSGADQFFQQAESFLDVRGRGPLLRRYSDRKSVV